MKVDISNTKVGGFNFEFLRAISYGVTGGSELGEGIAAIQNVIDGDFESWIKSWTNLADLTVGKAEEYLKNGDIAGARGAYLRASNYYRAAEFYATGSDPRQLDAWRKSRDCFQRAAQLMTPPIESLEIPFENAKLPGYFVSGGAGGKRPTLIAMSGFDGSGEELYHFIGNAIADRGWHCLIFEGPGQRGALHLNPGLVFRPDYEVPVRAVVDYAVSREDVDADRLALIGYSFGGVLAPRAAAFEPRIRACIADSLVVDVAEAWRTAWPSVLRDAPDRVFDGIFATIAHRSPDARWSLDQARWSMGIQHPHEMFKAFEPYTLHGLESKFRCPLLCLFGEDEIAQNSKKLIEETADFLEELKCPREIQIFTDEEGAGPHCQIGAMSLAHAAIFDWLERVFANKKNTSQLESTSTTALSIPPKFFDIIEKYHGKEFSQHIRESISSKKLEVTNKPQIQN